MKTMRAVVFHKPRDIRLEEIPLPSPGPGEVLLKVETALTCGTDFKAYRRGHAVMLAKTPARFGHELAATVAAVGAGVKKFKEGDRVVAANSAPCLKGCFFCARGQTQLCRSLALHNGAYAEYDLIPANIARFNLYRIPPKTEFSTAALAEPLACAVHAVDELNVRSGETAAVIGAGSMSLLLVSTLLSRGARVLVCGRGRENLDLAKEAGADDVFSSLDGDTTQSVLSATGDLGTDCVFEAVGLPETWQLALSMSRKGGRICLFGGCAPKTLVPIDAHRVHYDQLSLHGVFHHTPKHFAKAVDLLGSGAVKTGLLVRGSIRLSEIPKFYADNCDHSNPKVAVLP
jgi:L-iditol 2-dehydrogenase